MPRKPRLFLPRATYHVYCRVARGEFVFDDVNEAAEFVDTARRVRDLDGWKILAWCLMGNHYHLVVTTDTFKGGCRTSSQKLIVSHEMAQHRPPPSTRRSCVQRSHQLARPSDRLGRGQQCNNEVRGTLAWHLRGTWHLSFVLGEPIRVVVPLQGVLHTFKKRHRLMIQIQSTLFPFFDRNPQTFVPNIFEADESDFVKATHRVYLSGDHQSAIHLGVLPGLAGVRD